MDNKKSEIHYTLASPIKYGKNGDFIETTELTLRAPSRKEYDRTAFLKQSFFRAMKEIQSNDSSGKAQGSAEAEIKGDDIIMLLMMSNNVDMAECMKSFTNILSSICHIKDEEHIKLNSAHIDNISEDDLETMLGEYMANFLLYSWMSKLNRK